MADVLKDPVCWIVPPYGERRGSTSLPGMPPAFASETDDNFTLLLSLYVTAVFVSVAGVLVAVPLRRRVHRPGLHTLCAYYFMQAAFNMVVLVGFLANRCAFHNMAHCSWSCTDDRETCDGDWANSDNSCAAVGGAWGVAAKLAVLSAFVSGILTNGVLELGVFHSLRGLGWASSRQRFGRADRVLRGFIVLQLGCLAILTPTLLAIFGVLVAQGPRALMQKLGGQETETESGVWLAQVGMSAFGGIHVLASLWLLSKAACLAYQQPKGHEARRVAVAAFIAMLSSMLCYANFAAGWIDWYVPMACDSIVNDACVLAVLLMGDAAQYSSRPTSDSVADMMARSLFPLRTTRMKA